MSTSQCRICEKSNHNTQKCRFLNAQNEQNANHSQKDRRYQKNDEANFTEVNNLLYSWFNAKTDSKDI